MTPAETAVLAVLTSLSLAPGEDVSLPTIGDAAHMTRIAYNEMANQSIVCKGLVVQTILNRYARTEVSIHDVVSKPYQFAYFKPRVENRIDKRAMLHSAEAAIMIYSGLVSVPEWAANVTHFHKGRHKPRSWGDYIAPVGYKCGHTWYEEIAE